MSAATIKYVLSAVEVEYYRRAIEDNGVVEVRHERNGQWESGLYFGNLDALRTEIWRRQDTGNLYTILNRPTEATRRVGRGHSLRDEHIEIITRITFDVDRELPTEKPAKVEPATDAEVAAAAAGRDLLVRVLAAHGWLVPALGMSGNGAHAMYRTRLLQTEAWRQSADILYKGLHRHLHAEFAALGVALDCTVRNPSRVWRAYGTENRKGVSTPERPHRRARIQLPAGAWQVVRSEVVNRTVDSLRPLVVPEPSPAVCSKLNSTSRPAGDPRFVQRLPAGPRGDLRTLDVVGLFSGHGLYRRPLDPGKHSVGCPWESEHTTGHTEDTSTVIWEPEGRLWPNFHCSHKHCEGRKLTDVLHLWPEYGQYCARRWGCE